LADDKEDLYAKSYNVRVWIRNQKLAGRNLTAHQCLTSKHEIDNEIEPIGSTARKVILEFVNDRPIDNKADLQVCPLIH
jgi:hypothetical protein